MSAKSHRPLSWLALAAALLGLYLLGASYWVRNVKGVPRDAKLADLTGGEVSFVWRCPPGSSFRLVLGVPEQEAQPSEPVPVRGLVTIRHAGHTVHCFAIAPGALGRSNWLEPHGLRGGYILNWHGGNRLDPYVRAGRRYEVSVRLSQGPPPGASLWMYWLTARRGAAPDQSAAM